jgi:hypothetical protein
MRVRVRKEGGGKTDENVKDGDRRIPFDGHLIGDLALCISSSSCTYAYGHLFAPTCSHLCIPTTSSQPGSTESVAFCALVSVATDASNSLCDFPLCRC